MFVLNKKVIEKRFKNYIPQLIEKKNKKPSSM